MGLASRLYNGETRLDIVGRKTLWFVLSGVVILVGLVSLGFRGLNLGIDFEGGVVWELPAGQASVEDARDLLLDEGFEAKVQTLSDDSGTRLRIQTEVLSEDETEQNARVAEISDRLAGLAGLDVADISDNRVGASWGEEITGKAIRALVIFLILITIYVTLRFELKMALATLLALFHDILVTVGVYSLTGFEVTPATVIAILTILGYSIYDGIVVFDKVDENTRLVSSTNRVTYSSMVNLSLNQTLMRSLNTQITALLPMFSLLVVGSFILGATTLQEFAVALLIGQASGAYSSIFIASPALALLKEGEPRFKDVRRRIEAREASSGAGADAVAPRGLIADGGDATGGDEELVSTPAARGPSTSAPLSASGAIPPRPRTKKRR
jgi:preprotein translocase subunit SecF